MKSVSRRRNEDIITLVLIAVFSIIAVLGMLALRDYIGWASVPGEAGYITEMTMKIKYHVNYWAGAWGFVVWVPGYTGLTPQTTVAPDEVNTIYNMFFDCVEDGGDEVYAAMTRNIDWDSVTAGTPQMVDDYFDIPISDAVSATNTFVENISVTLGSRNITDVPAMYTYQYQNSQSKRFSVGILTDGLGNLIFVTTDIIANNPDDLYSNESTTFGNYQVMLPVRANSTQTYYFYTDPYSVCPSGFGMFTNGTVSGTVRHNITGELLPNVSVFIGTTMTTTNETGEYSLNIIEGRYNLVGTKTGFDIYVDTVSVFPELITNYNFTLIPETPRINLNGTVIGLVLDNTTGEIIENATVSIGLVSGLSDSSGLYNLSGPEGSYRIFGFIEGYYPKFYNINISARNITYQNITLSIIPPEQIGPGIGPGVGPGIGSGEGSGVGPGQQDYVIEKPGFIDYYISITDLTRRILLGQFLEEGIRVYNFKNSQTYVRFSVVGNVSPFVILSRDEFIVGPKAEEELGITFLGFNSTGIYTGELRIEGDINRTIPIEITVKDKDRLPVQSLYMKLATLRRNVYPGEIIDYTLDVRNMLLGISFNVSIDYNISDNNKTVNMQIGHDDLELTTFKSLIHEFKTPPEMERGRYILTATASYLNVTSSTSTVVYVGTPFYLIKLFGIIPVWLIAAILTVIGLIALIAYRMHKKALDKKKYKTEFSMNLLPKPGPRSGYIGKIAETEHKTYINLDQLTTHAIVAGSTGGGKTVAAQDIVEEALLKGIAVIVFDPTAQWSGMLRKCESENMLTMYPKFGMSPNDSRAFNGNVRAITDARQVIDLKKFLKPGEINIFTVNTLDPKDIDTFVANTVSQVFHANFPEEPQLKYLFVYDEVHRLLPKFGGSGEGFIQIERACREFRKWGIGMLLISQVLADFVGQIKANINTEVQMRTRDEGDLKRIATKYGKDLLQSLVKASIGSGMIQNAEYNRGKPYFVSFRPMMHSVRRLSDDVLQMYNKYNDMIDDIEYQLEQLEKDGVDVFDMKLELKLALDKVKSGSFNMVDIYLDGLRPKLEKEWNRLGKKPKKKETILIKEDLLKQELAKAEQERKKLVQQEAKVQQESAAKEPLFSKVFKPFTFDNGAMVSSLQELHDMLQTLDDQIFTFHFKGEKNDLPAWIEACDNELGAKLKTIAKKQELMQALAEEKKKNRMYAPKVEATAAGPEPTPATDNIGATTGGASTASMAPAVPAAKSSVSPAQEQKREGGEQEIDRLISDIEKLIKSGEKTKAAPLYAAIQQRYKELPAASKPTYYKKIIEIVQKLK